MGNLRHEQIENQRFWSLKIFAMFGIGLLVKHENISTLINKDDLRRPPPEISAHIWDLSGV